MNRDKLVVGLVLFNVKTVSLPSKHGEGSVIRKGRFIGNKTVDNGT